MATVGFKSVKIAVLDDNEKAIPEKTYTIDKSVSGAIEANITGLAPAQNVLYASNVPFFVTSKGTGEPKMALTVGDFEDLPAGALDEILGRTQNANKITTAGQDSEAPYCVVELITDDKKGNELYFSLLKGKFSFDGDDIKTSDNNGSNLSKDDLNFTGVARSSDGLVYAKGRAVDGVTQGSFEGFIFGNTVAVTGVVLTPSTVDLAVGGTEQLTATVSPDNATNPAVTYSSSNTAVATVNSTGLVTAVAAGTSTITVTTTDGGFKDIAEVTVS